MPDFVSPGLAIVPLRASLSLMPEVQLTTCPVCGARGRWSDGTFRPFCSKRCKEIDLGKWFSEEYKFSSPIRPADFGEALEDTDDTAPGSRGEGRLR
jgi:endogenous inhibitor of DNA gyrase (YacG/DUF329 family)